MDACGFLSFLSVAKKLSSTTSSRQLPLWFMLDAKARASHSSIAAKRGFGKAA
ncbi:MAG: hypothetical protein LBF93_10115 [Zoogloeaceae bacterium]|jgi:hypothetical protein|nr:hypothetical protein [Zoogloeaceae bacterium]